jgi:hypothetical protein
MIVSAYEGYERIVLLTEKDTVDFYKKCGFVDAQGIRAMTILYHSIYLVSITIGNI